MPKLFDLLSKDKSRKTILQIKNKLSEKNTNITQSDAQKNVLDKKNIKKIIGHLNFIAFDVETTGIDPKKDRIIEIGAVRFIKGEPEEEFSTFINPELSIPEYITNLTGISDKDVINAPLFSQISEKLLNFIGDLPLCGHQIDFDISFLNEELKRISLPELFIQQIDTALLSRIVNLNTSRYTLSHIAKIVGIDIKNAHRALDDARASGMVAVSLLPMIYNIPQDIRSIMAYVAPPSIIKDILFKSIEKKKYDLNELLKFKKHKLNKLEPKEVETQVDINDIKKIFSSNGKLPCHIKDYFERESQIKMAIAVAESLNNKSCLIVEAKAGTGKSLAYLIPAAIYAKENNCRIIVSTYTRNLQDQLMYKDLPLIKKIVGEKFCYSILKGRKNYLCLNRFKKLLKGELGNFSYKERMNFLPLIIWAYQTETGDIEEQNQFNIKWFSRVWHSISADTHFCEGRKCKEYSNCFLQHARLKALSSHIVVINHSLFYSEICSESSFLGKIGHIIFDEAHHLESCGHQQLKTEVDTNRFNLFLDLFSDVTKELQKISEKSKEIIKKEKELKSIVKHLRIEIQRFHKEIFEWEKIKQNNSVDFKIEYIQNEIMQNTRCETLLNVLKEAQDFMHDFYQIVSLDNHANILEEIKNCEEHISQLKADYIYLTAAVTEEHVFWIEGNKEKGWIKLCGVPLDIGKFLGPLWAKNNSGIVFTSATLSCDDSLEYFKNKIGLYYKGSYNIKSYILESPFSKEQTMACSVVSSPDVDSFEYTEFVSDTIFRLTNEFDKNILVLFTATNMLSNVYNNLKCGKYNINCNILAQGFSGNRMAILDEFSRNTKSVLLGAESFWEGIDVPGKACEILIIARLPFLVFTHPLIMAISSKIEQEKGDSFLYYSLPEAIIRFKQGIGRLIRGVNDRGVIIILDNRIITKSYRQKFIECINGNFYKYNDTNEMIEEIKRFFENK